MRGKRARAVRTFADKFYGYAEPAYEGQSKKSFYRRLKRSYARSKS